MAFLILCVSIAFCFEIMVLAATKHRHPMLKWIPVWVMELFPLSGAVYYMVRRPNSFLFGWEANVIFCVWIAAAILLGCLIAALVYQGKKK